MYADRCLVSFFNITSGIVLCVCVCVCVCVKTVKVCHFYMFKLHC